MSNTQQAQYNASPCKDCADRHKKCHSSCGDYLEYCRERDEINEKRHKEQDIRSYVNAQVIKTKKNRGRLWKGGNCED